MEQKISSQSGFPNLADNLVLVRDGFLGEKLTP
jgi:hypothetical protein